MVGEDAILLPDSFPEDRVPAGEYALSPRVGGPQILQEFWLDRDLVTVERYARFIAAGGYEDPGHWDAEGWAWLAEAEVQLPRFWDEPQWRRFLRPTRPIVGVSWFEACAFCRYAGRRLPSEREWEAAARGPEGALYPWGSRWEPGRAGGRGIGARVTWPVGYWRAGAGPFGHRDLIGNVWQWTCDPWSDDDEDAIAARGGSWASRPDQNRADHPNGYPRSARFSHLGFRTARI